VDLTRQLELKTATGYIKHAGAGIVIYRPEGAVRSGVRIGSEFFPGVSGLAQDPAIPRALAGGVTTALIVPGSLNLVGGLGLVVTMRSGAMPSSFATISAVCRARR
jgi:hypothetical protein